MGLSYRFRHSWCTRQVRVSETEGLKSDEKRSETPDRGVCSVRSNV